MSDALSLSELAKRFAKSPAPAVAPVPWADGQLYCRPSKQISTWPSAANSSSTPISGKKIGTAFEEFSNTAQRIGIYTGKDYVDILEKLIKRWEIDKITNLTDEAEKARDYLMRLPVRMIRLTERIKIPGNSFQFKWVEPAKL